MPLKTMDKAFRNHYSLIYITSLILNRLEHDFFVLDFQEQHAPKQHGPEQHGPKQHDPEQHGLAWTNNSIEWGTG